MKKCKQLPVVSDHDVVFVQASTRVPRNKPPQRRILLWKQADVDSLHNSIHEFSDTFIGSNTTSTDINQLWDSFKTFCSSAISVFFQNCPLPALASPRSPGAQKGSRRKKRAFRRARQSDKPEDMAHYKRLQKDTKYECKKAYNSYVRDTVSSDKNPKKLTVPRRYFCCGSLLLLVLAFLIYTLVQLLC